MAQPNVAREPSMEEILASIRRIIESNDPGGSQSASLPSGYSDEDDGDIRLTIDDEDTYASAEMVAANDPGPTVATGPVAASPAADGERVKNISLADLAARVRSASERVERPVFADAPPAEDAGPAARAESPVMTSRMADLRAATSRPVEPRLEVPMPGQSEAEIDEEAEFEAAAMADVEAATSPLVQPLPEAERSMPVHAEAGQDLKALVSAETVEQVSRSFGELAAAIDGQQRRSLDEMAEEMLRPMLQEWLDDNLPTLVERLVREEIERVARGPRR
ncbi:MULTISPECIES: PopZ family protein [Alphaproteobacteria]|uniref:DUF2497 domain-containing protein n=2 Tax=Alphaproteobacteria TaxID=28211 RepID=A0A512HHE6_9HYPH|nr:MULTISPECIES: PopZ family protein [Alphaproteobacteria]GEO84868.1 hypothetical protein RNA01_18000 [Ciceribacter naphthalenivorans]